VVGTHPGGRIRRPERVQRRREKMKIGMRRLSAITLMILMFISIGVANAVPKGTLSIDTAPVKGEVFVNGVSWGFAPQSKEVEVGTYTVSFGAVAGYTTPPPMTETIWPGVTNSPTGTYILIPPETVVTEPIEPGEGTVDATDEAGAEVDYVATGSTTVTVTGLGECPEGTPSFSTIGKYVDIYVPDPSALTSITIKVYYDEDDISGLVESELRLYYWDSTALAWLPCSDTGVDTTANYIYATLTATTTPDLSYLRGGPFGGGSPEITLTPDTGIAGTVVTVTGTGFAAESTIIITIAGVGGFWTSGPTLADGSYYSGPIADIPDTIALGAHIVTVTDADGNTATATLTIVTKLPAETTNQAAKDSTGAPKTSFTLGETVLASAEVANAGTQSQAMLIVVQWTDPELRVMAPVFISVTLAPGQSFEYAPGLMLPLTGYTKGTWTATIMVFSAWPAQGGVTIGAPVTITITVS